MYKRMMEITILVKMVSTLQTISSKGKQSLYKKYITLASTSLSEDQCHKR